MKSYITLYENVMNYFLNTTCIPKWEKLKYLKYIRLSLQDHQWSFKHAVVYRIEFYKMFRSGMEHKEISRQHQNFCTVFEIHFYNKHVLGIVL